jgi:flagellar basal-body rod modification protein FlgD
MTTTTSTSAFDQTLSNLGINRAATSNVKVTTQAAAQSLTQSDFLTLLTAQMKNQDPFNPMDNTQMVAQMAQFSSLSGISEMSSTLKAIQEKLSGNSTSDALGYVGKTVLTEGKTAYARTGGGIAGAVELGNDASNVLVSISDATGATVKTMNLGAQSKGTATYDWDGKTEAGTDAGAGPFTVTVTAQKNGATVPSAGLVWAPVQSVSTATGKLQLTLPGIGTIDASNVRQIG